MKRIALSILFVAVIACTSVLAQEKSDAYFKNVADDICNCSTEMQALSKKALKLQKEENVEGLQKLMVEIESATGEYESCINGLMIKYPEINGNKEYEKRAELALQKHCSLFSDMVVETEEEIPSSEVEGNGQADNSTSIQIDDIELELGEELAAEINDVEKQFEAFAGDVCDCISNEPGLLDEFQALKAKGDKEKLNLFRRSVPTKYNGFIVCLNQLNEKHAKVINGQSPSHKMKVLEEKCPTYLDLLKLE